MGGLMKRDSHGEREASDVFSRFDQLFDEWARMMPFRRWTPPGDVIHVEEYREDGTLVVHADLPGVDPDRDVEVTVSDGMLHIDAERRKEEMQEGKGYLRQEVRYGSMSRSLPLPAGVTEADITATYKAGVLEVRIPEPKQEKPKKIAINTS
jgi:HSP20 family protein